LNAVLAHRRDDRCAMAIDNNSCAIYVIVTARVLPLDDQLLHFRRNFCGYRAYHEAALLRAHSCGRDLALHCTCIHGAITTPEKKLCVALLFS